MSAIAGIGGGIGLVLGGILVDQVSYHWIFWLGAAMGLGRGRRDPALHPGVADPHARTRVDVRGALVLAVGLVLPLIAISQAPHVGLGQRAHARPHRRRRSRSSPSGSMLERRTPQPLADIEALATPACAA